MQTEPDTLEVFQDFTLSIPMDSCQHVHKVLERTAWNSFWYRNVQVEKRIERNNDNACGKVIAFVRDATKNFPGVELVLWPEDNDSESLRYRVRNVVPLLPGQIGKRCYNDALNDFVNKVVEPARLELNASIEMTARSQSLTSYTSSDAVEALHLFSLNANKAKGNSHPSDYERWLDFLIADHHASGSQDTEFFKRWLVQIEEWPPDVADELVYDWWKGRDVLEYYDKDKK